ncbi:monovalent cation/proton antiporter, MnhG/PhaG subunit [Thioflavicoccus mobilis 8321]|uniref:Monovalent cation/proton antiporter, MnhG/PhaG subunit n=1 Tax=Thioflavicoccus mobilis 8321 TaxID=765912 RepID=L0H0M7_9GAMM|nr:monovalent cation/H(+) antiporter subunit G [Thioflavicoccus mobilis]AGA91139.1 monovalent cation/proton antiporter, MnhG/PhaG subunit [Thioflavicoccus mobilis 8321]
MTYLGYLLMAGGLFFFWVSGLGLIRMPDFFTRMHAGTKATTLGSLLMLLGAACLVPAWAPKLLILAVFTLATNPLSSSVLARAAYRSGTDTVTMAHDACAARDAAAEPAAPQTPPTEEACA